jgi:hypothetical protein
MKRTTKNVLESLERADQFLTEHPLAPANAQVTALNTQLNTVIVRMTNHRNGQDLGLGKLLGGTASKAETAQELRLQMSRVSKIAKELDREQFPGIRQALRMPRNSYQELLSRAETFVTTVTPIKATFVDRGLPADFDEQLQDALDAFVLAFQRQTSGRTLRVQGTAGLEIAGRAGRKLVRAIDSILFSVYDDQPDLYAAWKSASRVEQANVASPAPSAPAPAPASAPAPAPAV